MFASWHLYTLNEFTSLWPTVLHPRVLKELTEELLELLSIKFLKPLRVGEVPVDGKMTTLSVSSKSAKEGTWGITVQST